MPEIGRCHTVAFRHHIAGCDDAGMHEGLKHVGITVPRRGAIEGDEPALRCEQQLVSPDCSGLDQLAQGLSDHPFAALAAIVDRGIEHIASGCDRLFDRLQVLRVRAGIMSSQIGAEPDGGQRQPSEAFPEMLRMGEACGHHPLAVASGAFNGRVSFDRHTQSTSTDLAKRWSG